MTKTLAFLLLFSMVGIALAQEQAVVRSPRGQAIAAGGFAVDLPAVVRVQGATAFFFTAMDVTNSSALATAVQFEFIASGVDAFGTLVASLPGHSSFHKDDIMQYLADQGFITQAQANSAFGTFLITFTNPNFTTGKEASASVRIYNFVTPGQRPSIGFAYRGEVLRLNGIHAASSIIRNTASTSGTAPQISTNLGLENVGINDAGALDATPITIQLTFYDASTGAQIGPQPTVTLSSGTVTQVTDVWTTYGLPQGTTDAIVIATETAGTAQIRGYVSLKDVNTNDVSFFYMQ